MAAYFFDSSALVKRYVQETGVEVVSALTRQTRSGALSPTVTAIALGEFRHDFAHQYHTVDITPMVVDRAMNVAETHALRGYDAVQCAVALVVHMYRHALGMPTLTFVSADAALNSAAAAEGLLVDDPNAHP